MIIENGKEVQAPSENILIGDPKMISSDIVFKGKGNVLFAEDGVRLKNSRITFRSDNALIYLSSCGKHPCKIKIDAWRGTTAYIGKDNYFNGVMNVILSERQNLIMGGGGVFSFDIWIRTADPHVLYDIESSKRINMSRSVLIGDHVWLGQSALILKGSRVGSGSVIAAAAVLAGKDVPSNSVFAGNPAVMIRDGVFFTGESVHDYTKEQTEESMTAAGDEYIFDEKGQVDTDDVFRRLSDEEDPVKRLELVKSFACDREKGRFYIG